MSSIFHAKQTDKVDTPEIQKSESIKRNQNYFYKETETSVALAQHYI